MDTGTSFGDGGVSNTPAHDVPHRSSYVRSELNTWMRMIRNHHLDPNGEITWERTYFKRDVPYIWTELKDLATKCSHDAVSGECITFTDKDKLASFLDDNLKRKNRGEKHVVVVSQYKPFTIEYDKEQMATITYHHKKYSG